MIAGNLYRLTDRAKERIAKNNTRYGLNGINHLDGIDLFVSEVTLERKVYPSDTLVVPLEVHAVTVDGKRLAGDSSRRLVALLSTGDMGTMWVDINDWEEVTSESLYR